VSYDPENHERMCRLRAEKVDRIADFQPEARVDGPPDGDLLVLSWGGTFGAVYSACQRARNDGRAVAHLHLRNLNPFPRGLKEVLSRYGKVLIPELNLGQLALMIRARFLIDAVSFTKVQGRPFTIIEVEQKIGEMLS
jgi:2-oxoglutarate ferredoxin oxidoreductase subunit alpha